MPSLKDPHTTQPLDPTQNSGRSMRHNPDVAWRKIGDLTLAITPGNNAVHRLNATGTCLWLALENNTLTENSLANILVEHFETDHKTALQDVNKWANNALQEGLLHLA